MKTRKSPLRYTEESDWTLKRERSKEVEGEDDVKKKSVVNVCGLYGKSINREVHENRESEGSPVNHVFLNTS